MKPYRAKSPKPLDEASLERLAMHYVARYATTESKLQDYLSRKYKMRENEEEQSDSATIIAPIVAKMVALGFVNDLAYGEMKTGALLRRGYGARRIKGALQQAGIAQNVSDDLIAAAPVTSLDAALTYAKRRRIGPYSAQPPTREAHQRAIATLLRAGHSYDDARAVLEPWGDQPLS
jgi:regulatory protein